MRPLTDGSRFARRAVIADVAALLVFLAIGLDTHAENDLARFAALAAIFVGSWLVTAWVIAAYRPPTTGHLVATLVLAVPLAIAIRAAIVQAWTTRDVVVFMTVALIFCAAFTALARLAVLFSERRST
jgi:hypothetical protein